MPSAILLAPRSSAGSGAGGSRSRRGAEHEPQEKKQRREDKPDEEMAQAGGAAESSGRQGGGGRRAGKKKLTKAQTENRGLWSLVLKALLQLQQDQRTLASAVLYVYTVKTESDEIVKMQEQGRAYADLCKDQPDHGQGPPHLFVFSALLTSLVERGAAVGQKNLGALQLMQTRWTEWELDERADAVRICRQAKAWDQAIRKIYIAFGMGFRDEDKKALLASLVQIGAVAKHGRAPAGGLERELGQWLSSFVEGG